VSAAVPRLRLAATPRLASPTRRSCSPVKVEHILTNWKLRLAFIVEASIFHWNYLLAVVVGVAIALLRIWLEVRQHEPG
jgi:hypothetical protein